RRHCILGTGGVVAMDQQNRPGGQELEGAGVIERGHWNLRVRCYDYQAVAPPAFHKLLCAWRVRRVDQVSGSVLWDRLGSDLDALSHRRIVVQRERAESIFNSRRARAVAEEQEPTIVLPKVDLPIAWRLA